MPRTADNTAKARNRTEVAGLIEPDTASFPVLDETGKRVSIAITERQIEK